jgi:hypothetical protein
MGGDAAGRCRSESQMGDGVASEDVQRRLFLLQELDVSILAIEAGLAELQASRPYRPRHFVFLLLLSTGFERLLKIALHLRALNTTGAFHPARHMRETYDHNIVKLSDAVAQECFTHDHRARPLGAQDFEFVTHDPRLGDVLALLSAFAKADRYVYMDGISDPGGVGESPQRRWGELEVSTMLGGEHARLYGEGNETEAKNQANRALAACIERYVRALARLFAWGALGDLGRQVSPALSAYCMLDDGALGTREYGR